MKSLSCGEYYGKSLNAIENDHIKLCITQYGEQAHIEKHHHENAYLSLLFSGSYLEQSASSVQRISAGEALFRPMGYDHENYFESLAGKCFNIEFKPSWFQLHGTKGVPKSFALRKFNATEHPSLYRLLLHLRQDVPNMDLASEYVYDWYKGLSPENSSKKSIYWVKQVVSIIHDELYAFHSLQDLADRVHVHPVYMARAFKEKQGLTISEYQLKVKLDKAMTEVLNTDKSVGDLSFALGFYDDSHFIRSFKAHFGWPPSQFRKKVDSLT